MILLIVYVLVALGFSFLCSVAEAVLLSITPAYIGRLEKEQPLVAGRLLQQKENIDRPLAAILSLNTIAHTVGAAGAGAQAVVVFGDAAVGIASAVLTLLILVLSEIIPKTLGAAYWRELAPAVSRFARMLELALFPLVALSMQLTKILSAGRDPNAVDREEITAMAEAGARGGEIGDDESHILKNLFQLRELVVEDIMTPRTVVFSLPAHLTISEFFREHAVCQFSRIPIFDENRDEVSGFVLKGDLLLAKASGEGERTLVEFRREIHVVPLEARLSDVLERLLDQRAHIAVVNDRYGGMSGIVTLEDAVETLLGMEIVDEADREADMQKLARRQWEKRAQAQGLKVEP